MISLISLLTPGEIQLQLAESFKQVRLSQDHSRKKAAQLSGVPEATLRHFETSGNISLRQFLMLCHVYGQLEQCQQLFVEPQAKTIDEMLQTKPKRQRGRS